MIKIKSKMCRIEKGERGYRLLEKTDKSILYEIFAIDKYPECEGHSGNIIYIGLEESSPSYQERQTYYWTEIKIDCPDNWTTIFCRHGRYAFIVGAVNIHANVLE